MPLALKLWSSRSPGFKGENDEVLKIIRAVYAATGGIAFFGCHGVPMAVTSRAPSANTFYLKNLSVPLGEIASSRRKSISLICGTCP